MKRALAILVVMFTTCATRAEAEGINGSWDDCGLLGTSAKTFACNTNTGEDRLVLSLQFPSSVAFTCGVTAVTTMKTDGFVPDWWRHRAPDELINPIYPQCRDTLGMRPEYEPTGCPGFGSLPILVWAFSGATGMNQTVLEFAFVHLLRALDGAPIAVNADTEYYLMTWVLNHSRTVGPDACAGCEIPACIVFEYVDVLSAESDCNSAIGVRVTNPLQRNYVTWQNADILNCAMSAPVKSATWGQVKSLYR